MIFRAKTAKDERHFWRTSQSMTTGRRQVDSERNVQKKQSNDANYFHVSAGDIISVIVHSTSKHFVTWWSDHRVFHK